MYVKNFRKNFANASDAIIAQNDANAARPFPLFIFFLLYKYISYLNLQGLHLLSLVLHIRKIYFSHLNSSYKNCFISSILSSKHVCRLKPVTLSTFKNSHSSEYLCSSVLAYVSAPCQKVSILDAEKFLRKIG